MSVKNPFPFDHWPQQSPIKLFTADALFVDFPADHLRIDYSGAPYQGAFEGESGHKNFVLDANLSSGQSPPILTLGRVKARLVKIHLHTPSEHDLEGKDHDGEVHLIHQIENPTTGSELIVLGVFFAKSTAKKSAKAGAELTEFFETWTAGVKAAKRLGKSSGGPVAIDPNLLLPGLDKWFQYEGSLTSEPYNEFVTWVVFPTPLGITSDGLKKLKAEAHQPERPTQDINRRYVLRNFR
ncbi:carbonic anhydrase family protein [Gemmata sp. JC717]|uniref:carbonic anhydrase family protein n=1 Tax=Gemmata algarum TaxID=2975278 RepID=UPI0021BB5FFE|nr:carbonic anhydrase family protein [Gemmata algarum]MDY3554229.1 carbonic anhydrase family protein [Gemmata algarum]